VNGQSDWRLHGAADVDVVSPIKLQIRSGGNCTMELVDPVQLRDGWILALPVPNPTAMMLHASRRAFDDAQKLLSADHYKNDPRDTYSLDSSSDAVDVVERLVLSVFAAYTSIECFANEWIPPWLTYRQEDPKGGHQILGKEDMERRLPLKRKLDYVLPSVFKVASPKGNRLWQAFVKLEAARNRVVHMKQADRERTDVGTDTIWKQLFKLPAPHLTAKALVDWYMADAPHVPHLSYDNFLPVKPRWLVRYPLSDESKNA